MPPKASDITVTDLFCGAGMAFPGDYVVLGNKRDKVKQYGNAVTPPALEVLSERGIASLN